MMVITLMVGIMVQPKLLKIIHKHLQEQILFQKQHILHNLHSIDSMLFIGRIIQKQTTPLGLIRLHIHNQRLLEICPKMVIKLLSGGLRQETVQSCMDTIQQLTAECNQSEIRVSCRPKMIMQL